jgi:hypothetical protein
VAELKEQPGQEILTFGSRTLWNDLLADVRRFDGSDNLVLRYRVAEAAAASARAAPGRLPLAR